MNERGKQRALSCKLVKLALNQEPMLLVANNNGGKALPIVRRRPRAS
jgi:hypothetical protein